MEGVSLDMTMDMMLNGESPYRRPRGSQYGCYVPSLVTLRGDRLRWDLGKKPWRPVRDAVVSPKMLFEFIDLRYEMEDVMGNKSRHWVAKVASRFGYLGVVEHATPRLPSFYPANPAWRWGYCGFVGVLGPT